LGRAGSRRVQRVPTGAATVNKAPNAKGKSAKRQMNTVKFWLEPALDLGQGIHQSFGHNCRSVNVILRFPCIQWEREKKFLSVPTVYKGNAK
jgi:hypothetical protein